MLRKFEDMNLQMEKTGSFKPATAKEALLQMVARNNLLLSDIILKLGISERFDAAWKDADCNKVRFLMWRMVLLPVEDVKQVRMGGSDADD